MRRAEHRTFFRYGRRRIDDSYDLGDLVDRKTAALRMVPDGILVRREKYTKSLVISDVGLNPLDLRPGLSGL